MGVAIQTFSELRSLSASRYLASDTGVLGGAQTFTAQVLLRLLAQTDADEFICGNVDVGNQRGWAIYRLSDSDSGATANFRFEVWEGGVAQDLDFSLPLILGQAFILSCVYSGDVGLQRAYVNGIPLALRVTTGVAMTLSTGRFSIGYDVNNLADAATHLGFMGFGFTNRPLSQDELAANTVATLKAQDITSSQLAADWVYLYSTARSCGDGVAATWANYGSGASTATLAATGRASMILGTPPACWASYGGVGGGVAPTPSTTALNVYVSQANGNDANNGLTPDTPIATLSRAWELLPNTLTQPFVVHMDGGAITTLTTTYAWEQPRAINFVGPEAMIIIYGDGAGQPSSSGVYVVTDAVARTVTGASTSAAITITGGGATTNAYRDMTLEMVTGPAAGQRRSIVQNTATQIFPIEPFCDVAGNALTPANGNTFRILRPNVVLNTDNDNILGPLSSHVHFVGVAITQTNADYESRLLQQHTMMLGVELRNGQRLTLEDTSLYAGCAGQAGPGALRPAIAQSLWVRIHAALALTAAVDSGNWDGWGVMQVRSSSAFILGGWVDLGVTPNFQLYGFFTGGGLWPSNSSSVYLYGVGVATLYALGDAYVSVNNASWSGVEPRMIIDNTGGPQADSLGAFGANAQIELGYYSGGTLVLTQAQNQTVIDLQAQGRIASFMQITATTNGTRSVYVRSQAEFEFGVTGGVSSFTGSSSSALAISSGGKVQVAAGTVTFAGGGASTIDSGGELVCSGTAVTISATADSGLNVSNGGRLHHSAGALTINGSVTGAGACELTGAGSVLTQGTAAGTLTIANSNAGASASGLRVLRGGQFSGRGGASTAITTAGAASSYGVLLQAGGRAIFEGSPTGVAGDVAGRAFHVDATDSSVAALVANTAVTGAGASIVVYRA